MEQQISTSHIQRELEEAGLEVIVEARQGVITLSGRVESQEARQAAEDIVAGIAPDHRIDNDLEVETILPVDSSDFSADEPSAEMADSVADIRATGGELAPDFTDQELLTDPTAAAGSGSGSPGLSAVDPVADGDETYFPPTDPVVTTDQHGQAAVLGGFSASSMDEVEPEPSTMDRQFGDEAIAEAIRRELREDAATTELQIDVLVRDGVVRLRGAVPTLDDADNAEAVASRVSGVREVVEELDVPSA